MNNDLIRIARNRHVRTDSADMSLYGVKTAHSVRTFHASFPEYEPTPLCELSALSRQLHLGSIFVKDESKRFGLNAFKVLGGSYCVGTLLAEKAGIGDNEFSYPRLIEQDVNDMARDLTVITATDGNHGRGIAWSAREFGVHAVVYMPKGTARERLENIRKLGAEAEITDFIYDDTVRMAARQARENGWLLTQDTSWPGYERIPSIIMQGYTTMGLECIEQLKDTVPTHVFLQAGVGSMAASLSCFLADYYQERKPKIIIVEANGADCLYKTAEADDGTLHKVTDLHTIMAGLCCGEPCTIAWDLLEKYADYFMSVPDQLSAKGMRILGAPLPGDQRIISGESGAVSVGIVAEIMTNDEYAGLREELGFSSQSRVLCLSTEGDTDPENYRRIVWDGSYPSI